LTAIRVRHLRLDGPLRPYDVSFVDDAGQVKPLAVIAGQILTGKTSILQFVTYCLGRDEFPTHDEIRLAVRSALIEVEIGDVVYVIERACVLKSSKTAMVHSCGLDGLDEPHQAVELPIVAGAGDESLSVFFLRHLGVAEVVLKEAPTQASSGVDRLSIRDLLRLVYVRFEDLGTDALLLENRPHVVHLKHLQLIDVLFNAHDNRAASVAAELKGVNEEIRTREAALATVDQFMLEQQVPSRQDLEEQVASLRAEIAQAREVLGGIEREMEAVAHFGDEQRQAHQQATTQANTAATDQRSATTQIERLGALAAQYDQDIKKLLFAKEANVLFDPLLISVCPWCLQPVTAPDDPGSDCSVCHQPFPAPGDEPVVEIDAELRAIRKRRDELSDLLGELHDDLDAARASYSEAAAEAARRQQALDDVMRGRFAPFITQRDAVIGSIAGATQDIEQRRRHLGMHDGADRRRNELGALRQKHADLLLAQTAAEEATTRDEAAELISDRYVEILTRFGYPKLTDARVDNGYVPYARGQMYNAVGSAGARTLVTLAWYLAVFELVAEHGGPHPGLLMIDSPQKGLAPTEAAPPPAPDVEADVVEAVPMLPSAPGESVDDAEPSDEDFQNESIAGAVYAHLLEWSASEVGQLTQIIVVDNVPQASAEPDVVVRYSGRADLPPYGLIDDATS
jgi:hypothetical protein